MNTSQKKIENCLPVMLCTLLVLILFAFVHHENREDLTISNASFHPYVETSYNSQAVIPATINLPVCASFSDDNHILLDKLSQSTAQVNQLNDLAFRTAQQKHLFIKPFLNIAIRRIIFSNPDPNDFIAIN